jgi:ligand-binding sensor domain-containing protein/signal transduction histidine kinase
MQYRIDVWTAEDGLPQSSVTAIVQTRDGYLWLGTFGGMTRFDGSKFKVFDPGNTTQQPSSRVVSLFEDRHGAVWIGTEDGQLTRDVGGRLEVFSPPNRGTVSRFIKGFAETADGSLWLLSGEGQVLSMSSGRFAVSETNWGLQGTAAKAIATDSRGRLWVGTEKELAVLEDGKFVSAWDQAREPKFGVDGLSSSGAGGLWVAGNGRLRRFEKGRWVADYGAYPWTKGVLSKMLEDRQGQVWVGVYRSGVFRFATNGAVLGLSRTEGLPGNLVRSLLEDSEGNIWAGTDGHGLARVKPAVFRSYGREQGLSSDQVLTVCEGQDGELWIGTNGEGINRLKDGVVEHYGASEGLTNEYVWSVCQTRNKVLWAGTWGGGLFKREGRRFQPMGVEGPSGPVVCALYEDQGGSLWLGQIRNSPQVAILRGGQLSPVTLLLTQPGLDARAVVEDTQGNLWVGTRGDGLYCLRNGEQRRIGTPDGLSSEFILSLYPDSEGALWIGTREGLNRLRGGKFAIFTTKQGLANNSVVCIGEDGRRNLWFGCGSGVFRVNKDELERVASGEQPTVHCFSYARADGLPSLECSTGCQPAGCKTRDGRLWFPTVKGLAVVDPESVPFNPRPPPVHVDEVLIEDRTASSVSAIPTSAEAGQPGTAMLESNGTMLRVPPGKSRFEFHYTALSFTAPEKIRFKYRLEGLEHNWVDAGSERAAHYSYLRPGQYRFWVMACNNDGVWNEAGASLGLIVLPHFWQTWWFRLLAAVAVVLLLAAAYEIRIALVRRLARVRLRIARDLHDEVGSNLGTIALLSEVLSKNHHNGAEEISELRRVATQTIDSLRDIVWFLDPAADNMAELALRMKETARTMLRGTTFTFVSSGEADAPKPSLELRRNLFPIFKEILHNISRHAHASRVAIALETTPRHLLLRVKDDGVGFDDQLVRPGNGLKNLRRRAADLNGNLQLESAPGQGTQVVVSAPIP